MDFCTAEICLEWGIVNKLCSACVYIQEVQSSLPCASRVKINHKLQTFKSALKLCM